MTLPDLPAELLIGIFKATDSVPTALALAKTSHRLHNIWTSNADVILPSIVECFPQAQKLATTQEKAAQEQSHAQETGVAPRPQVPITINQRICRNATLALRVLETFENKVLDALLQTTSWVCYVPFTPTERTTFLHGFYLAMTFVTLGRDVPFLFNLPMLSYMQMSEAMHVLDLYLTATPSSPLRTIRSPETDMTVPEAVVDFKYFHADLKSFAFFDIATWPDKEDRWDKVPHGYFTLDDGYRAKVDGERGEGPLMHDVLEKVARIVVMFGGEVP